MKTNFKFDKDFTDWVMRSMPIKQIDYLYSAYLLEQRINKVYAPEKSRDQILKENHKKFEEWLKKGKEK